MEAIKKEEFKKHVIMDSLALRQENLVYNHHGKYHSFGFRDFGNFSHPKMNHDYGFYAIPITELLLEKCGFVCYDEHDGIMTHEECAEFQIQISNLEEEVYHIWDGAYTDAPCDYLHQLQNLYYCLVGKELKINL